ncbi:MAG: hypothetical protein NTY07_14315 [Bacteroidia bacterium]|nr:hypothetical protein [Bacteroidia bacterium]
MKSTLKQTIKRILKNVWLFLFLLCFSYSCDNEHFQFLSKEVPIVYIQDPYRTLPGYKFTASTQTLKDIYKKNGVQYPDSFIKYTVSYHRLVYTTTYKGKQINASGAIIIPINPANPPAIVSFQHGTMFADRDAPSKASSIESFPLFNEYIVFLPDYIGYDESAILHPYYIFEPSVMPVIDMLKAGKKYLNDNHIPYDQNKLFLSGHSEGGYVTVAVQKELETHPVAGLKITASAPSAGPYDVGATGKLIFQNNTYPSPAYLILILSAYNDFYWQRPITDFFQQPYANNIPNLLNGSYNENEINQRLTTSFSVLITPGFLNDYRAAGETGFKEMLKLNSVNNWAPKTPTRLYHGTVDDIVPYEISQKTYESFISNGSDPSIVKLVPLTGIGHEYLTAYLLIREWFKTFK